MNVETFRKPEENEKDTRTEEAGWLIHSIAVANGAVAFTLANTVVGDTVLITGLSLYLVHRLGKLYGAQNVNAQQIISQCFAYYAGGYLTGKLLFWLPGIGNWANAASLALITETIGWTCVSIFASGRKTGDLSREEWKSILKGAKRKAQEFQANNRKTLKKMTAEEKKEFQALTRKLRDDSLPEEEKKTVLSAIQALYEAIEQR